MLDFGTIVNILLINILKYLSSRIYCYTWQNNTKANRNLVSVDFESTWRTSWSGVSGLASCKDLERWRIRVGFVCEGIMGPFRF